MSDAVELNLEFGTVVGEEAEYRGKIEDDYDADYGYGDDDHYDDYEANYDHGVSDAGLEGDGEDAIKREEVESDDDGYDGAMEPPRARLKREEGVDDEDDDDDDVADEAVDQCLDPRSVAKVSRL